jgi:hypothetical protein
MTACSKDLLLEQLDKVDRMPSIPVVVAPWLRYREQPVDQLDLQKIVDLLSQDKSLTARSPDDGSAVHAPALRVPTTNANHMARSL